VRVSLARVTLVILLAEALALDLEGDLVDFFVVVGSVLALVPPLEIIVVLKHRRPSAVATTVVLVVIVLLSIVFVAILVVVVYTAVGTVPSLNGSGEGGDRKGQREES
ncbi:hypothetical protein EV421DRAFT_1755958, partial [Armillaria borealis]